MAIKSSNGHTIFQGLLCIFLMLLLCQVNVVGRVVVAVSERVTTQDCLFEGILGTAVRLCQW